MFLGDYPEEHNLIASTSIVLVKYHRMFTKRNIISLSNWKDKIDMIIKSGWSSPQVSSQLSALLESEGGDAKSLSFIYLFIL